MLPVAGPVEPAYSTEPVLWGKTQIHSTHVSTICVLFNLGTNNLYQFQLYTVNLYRTVFGNSLI
jgi:hypothetical protein